MTRNMVLEATDDQSDEHIEGRRKYASPAAESGVHKCEGWTSHLSQL